MAAFMSYCRVHNWSPSPSTWGQGQSCPWCKIEKLQQTDLENDRKCAQLEEQIAALQATIDDLRNQLEERRARGW